MSEHSKDNRDAMRRKLIGLGEKSMRKSYYPELKAQMKELERFHALLEEARDAILLVNAETDILADCNATTSRISGYKDQLLLGYPYTKIFEPSFKEKLELCDGCQDNSGSIITNIITLTGDKIPVEVSVRQTSFEGRPFAILVARDISLRKKAEDEVKRYQQHLETLVDERTNELQQANTQLQNSLEKLQLTQSKLIEAEKMASLATLVAGVAHEINTPLGTALTAASSLQSRVVEISTYVTQEKVSKSNLLNRLSFSHELSNAIMTNLHRASELVQSFKQVSVDQNTSEKRIFNVRNYMDNILISMRSEYARTSHKVALSCPPDLRIDSYPSALTQIVTNFIMNSLVHGFHNMENGRMNIHVEESDDNIIIQYSDNGKGMSAETLEKIFDPFYSTKTTAQNTGLGMHVVYNIVTQQLGGIIAVESTENEGVCFTITLPKNYAAQSTDS
ncbi:MAG: ATP-binding protein [Desulfovibrio sp.]